MKEHLGEPPEAESHPPEHQTPEQNSGEPVRTYALRRLPEPSTFWIACSPRSWRCGGGLWTDLANGRLGGFQQTSQKATSHKATSQKAMSHKAMSQKTLPLFDAADLDDLLVLPPVPEELARDRDHLAMRWIEAGTPVLLQLRPGELCEVGQAHPIYDLLEPLLDDQLHRFTDLPAGSTAVWPLISGLTDDSDVWDEGLELLQAAGVKCVQPLTLELQPRERRRLAEGRDDDVFDALFHDPPPSERSFACSADRHGLAVFMRRPRSGGIPRVENNRRIAADLALAGELWLRLGRSVASGQALFRAARGAENTDKDLVALAREENLMVMTWLDAKTLEVTEEIIREGTSVLLQELMDEYLRRTVRKRGKAEGDPPLS